MVSKCDFVFIKFYLKSFFLAYPTYLTYMPASALGGLGQALIFTGAGACIQKLCQIYCKITNSDAARTQAIFFGVFGSSIQIGKSIKNCS